MPAEPPPPLRACLALPMRRRSQRQQRLLRAQPEPWCLLPKRRKAKKIQILFFTTPSTTSVPPGQRGFPGADLKAAVQKSTWPSSLAITQTLLCLCQFGLVLGEPRLRPFKIHGVFLPLISIEPLRGLRDRMDSGTKGSRRTRRKATISRYFRGASRRRTRIFLSRGLFRRRLARHLRQNRFRFV